MTTTLTADGQIPIPSELIEQLGLVPGQPIELQSQGDLLVAWKTENDPFGKWRGRGIPAAEQTVDEYLRVIRDGHSG